MQKKRFSRLETVLCMLALIPLAFSWGFVVRAASRRENAAIDDNVAKAYQLSRFAAVEESEFFLDSYRDLESLADAMKSGGEGKKAEKLASSMVLRNDAYFEIGAANRDGNLIFDASSGSIDRTFSKSEWFAKAKS